MDHLPAGATYRAGVTCWNFPVSQASIVRPRLNGGGSNVSSIVLLRRPPNGMRGGCVSCCMGVVGQSRLHARRPSTAPNITPSEENYTERAVIVKLDEVATLRTICLILCWRHLLVSQWTWHSRTSVKRAWFAVVGQYCEGRLSTALS